MTNYTVTTNIPTITDMWRKKRKNNKTSLIKIRESKIKNDHKKEQEQGMDTWLKYDNYFTMLIITLDENGWIK